MQRFGRALVAVLLGAGMATSALGAFAQDATPIPVPVPAGCTVVAGGLINPRFLALGDDGTIYVTEAGNGGDEMVMLPGGTPASGPEEGAPVTRGTTGQVTAIAPNGTTRVVASGISSYNEGVGPAGIVLANGKIWISVGGGAALMGVEPIEYENSILSIDPATGEITKVAYLGQYEIDNNPDGTDVNPNLYGLALGADGMLYVNDAGGNTIYKVDPATGEFSLAGIVPAPELPADMAPPQDGSPVADESQTGPPQPVPTGLTVGPDGLAHLVTLGAFIPGAGAVLTLQADGSVTMTAGGLTTGIGIAFGPDGALYVSELASLTDPNLPPGPGRVIRVGTDGTMETVVDGIMTPHGLAFDAAGNLFVVANSTTFGPPPASPAGQVLRCDGIAAPGA